MQQSTVTVRDNLVLWSIRSRDSPVTSVTSQYRYQNSKKKVSTVLGIVSIKKTVSVHLYPEIYARYISLISQTYLFFCFLFEGSTYGPTKIAKPAVFQAILLGIGKSFQSAITAPRINLTGYDKGPFIFYEIGGAGGIEGRGGHEKKTGLKGGAIKKNIVC